MHSAVNIQNQLWQLCLTDLLHLSEQQEMFSSRTMLNVVILSLPQWLFWSTTLPPFLIDYQNKDGMRVSITPRHTLCNHQLHRYSSFISVQKIFMLHCVQSDILECIYLCIVTYVSENSNSWTYSYLWKWNTLSVISLDMQIILIDKAESQWIYQPVLLLDH